MFKGILKSKGLASILQIRPTGTKHCRYINIFFNLNQQEPKVETLVYNNKDYTPVYKFPLIRPLALINRLKLYQTVLTVTSIPSALILNYLNYIDVGDVQFIGSLGISGCIALFSLGYLAEGFIGFIYYNEKTNTAKIAYIDYWGRRKDIEIPPDDIIPISELPISFTDALFLKFRRFSTKETLKINLQFGIVLDKDKFKMVL